MDYKYYTFSDLLKDEIDQYAVQLRDEIYDDDIYEEEDNLLESDSNLELLYEGINKYVNLETDEEFKYNNSNYTSLMCKLMIMSLFYEYGTICYEELDDIAKQIYNCLSISCNMKNALKLYNKYHRDILENYDFISSIELTLPEHMDEIRLQIIEKGQLVNVCNINPYAIFDYRFLLGLSFHGEHIKSVTIANALKSIVDKVIVDDDMNEQQIISELQYLLNDDEELADFVDDYKDYMLSNIYEKFNCHENKSDYEKGFIQYLEDYERDMVLEHIILEDKTLSSILYSFYMLNKNGCDEQEIQSLREYSKKSKRLELVKQYNPFYVEEESYFKNRRSSDGTS